MKTIEQANVVLLANQFNVSIFQQIWFLENNILSREDFGEGSYFTPVATNIQNNRFALLIIPERIQLTFFVRIDEQFALLQQVILGIKSTLPHTPYSAIGANFNYWLAQPESAIGDAGRQIFLCPANPLASLFSSDDARFGFYASQDILDSRFKLDVKPAIKADTQTHGFAMSLNFHRQVGAPNDIEHFINTWPKMFEYSQNITEQLNTGLEQTNA